MGNELEPRSPETAKGAEQAELVGRGGIDCCCGRTHCALLLVRAFTAHDAVDVQAA